MMTVLFLGCLIVLFVLLFIWSLTVIIFAIKIGIIAFVAWLVWKVLSDMFR